MKKASPISIEEASYKVVKIYLCLVEIVSALNIRKLLLPMSSEPIYTNQKNIMTNNICNYFSFRYIYNYCNQYDFCLI